MYLSVHNTNFFFQCQKICHKTEKKSKRSTRCEFRDPVQCQSLNPSVFTTLRSLFAALFDLCGPEIDKFPCLFAQKDHLVTAVWQRVQEKHPNVPFQDKDDAMNFLEGHVKCWNGAKGAAARSVASEIHSKLCAYRYIKTENSGFLLRCKSLWVYCCYAGHRGKQDILRTDISQSSTGY